MSVDLSNYLEIFADEAREHLENLSRSLLELERHSDDPELVNVMFRSAHTLKSMSATMGFEEVAELTHKLESLLALVRTGELQAGPEVVEVLFRCLDALQEMTEAHISGRPQRVPTKALAAKIDKLAAGAPAASASLPSKPVSATVSQALSTKVQYSHSIRVDTQRLDTLLGLLEALEGQQGCLRELCQDASRPELTVVAEQIGRLVAELRSNLMQTRMVQLEAILNRFPRMVRDLARTLGKQVELVLSGGKTALDRSLAEELGEALVHLVRNSIDHGIESPAERLAAGKPATGTLSLRAYQQGGQMLLRIQDDGRGIDPERIRVRARAKGLISAEQSAGLSDEEALLLIFTPGFSTAERVTDISGRGVGMDVVHAAIENLGGELSLDTQTGQGTSISIRLPLTQPPVGGRSPELPDL